MAGPGGDGVQDGGAVRGTRSPAVPGWRVSAGCPRPRRTYDTLSIQTGSPVFELNRAIAVAELDGPGAGLAILDGLELGQYRYFHSARAELLRRAGRDDEARHAYRRALELAQTDAERRSLNDRLSQLSPG